MRKYFLLAATALLAASTANAAGTNTANLGADAELQFAAEFDCTNLSFGTITLNSSQDLTDVSVTVGSDGTVSAKSGNVTTVTGQAAGDCSSANVYQNNWFVEGSNLNMPASVEISNGTKTGTVTFNKDGYMIGGEVEFAIPDNKLETLQAYSGQYTGAIQITQTY